MSVLLIAVNLRTAVTSVGPLLDQLEAGTGLTSGLAGILTTMPVISFAVLGAVTPKVARRLGEKYTLVLAMALMTVGLVARALVSSPWLFLGISVAALAGGAMGNVLLPVVVKRYFPDRIGPMTAAYTTSMAIGTTVAAGVSVPLASLRDPADWRIGLGFWALPAGIGVLMALLLPRVRPSSSAGATPDPVAADPVPPAGSADPTAPPIPNDPHPRPDLPETADPADPATTTPRRSMRHSATAWALAVFFGTQSFQAYVQFGWFALLFHEQSGFSPARSGLLVALLTALSIPMSMVIPSLTVRMNDHRPMIAFLIGCTAVSYVGMLVAPRSGALVWVVLAGLGAGSFPLALTMIGLRTRHVRTTASLSAFAQSIGYTLAGLGPLLVGVLHGATGGWTWPFIVLFADLAVMSVAGWVIGQQRYVEDDLAGSRV